MSDKIPYMATLVRQNDPDRFFLTLLQPAPVRPALWALLAFYYEIAKTREVVSEPTLGYMRLQWWREALQNIYGGGAVPRHDVLAPLATAIRDYSLPRDLFEQMLVGREYDLENKTPVTLDELYGYIAATVLPVTRLILRVTSDKDEGAALISQAYGVAGIMRAIPAMARQGRTLVPQECGSVDQLFRDAATRQDVMTDLYNASCQSLLDAGYFSSPWLRGMAKTTHLYLRHMQKLEFNLLDERFSLPPPFLQIKVLLG